MAIAMDATTELTMKVLNLQAKILELEERSRTGGRQPCLTGLTGY